jgi:hyperosmotically inducible periplasmic protein
MTPIIGAALRLALLALALLLAGCGLPERVEREPAPDARLATRVKIALIEAGTLDAAAIFVDAQNGLVRLGGFTDSPESRERAAEVAEAVPGVVGVQNAISLR